MGYIPHLAPLLTLKALLLPPIDPRTFQAIILTSANAVSALEQWSITHPTLLRLPVLTTGKATAIAAQKAGFQNTIAIQGAATRLVEEASLSLSHTIESVLYPCASQTAHDLAGLLAAKGIACTALPVYAMQASSVVPEVISTLWNENAIDAVLLYSPRTATIFAELVRKLPPATPPLFCLSEAIADALPIAWKQHAVWPDIPSEEQLLARLHEVVIRRAK